MNHLGALVTGASSTLGRAVVEALSAGGYRIVETSLESQTSGTTVAQIAADLSDAAQAELVVNEAVKLLDGLDTVVCIAGAMPIGRIEDTTMADLDAAFHGSFRTFFTVARASIPRLRAGGSIVAISSINATLASPGVAAYASAKGAVESLVRQLALDQAARSLRVNAVAPGLIDTGQFRNGGLGYPRGSAVTVEEVASAVAFLAGPAASGITGVVLPVDAGLGISSPASFLREDLIERLRPSEWPSRPFGAQ